MVVYFSVLSESYLFAAQEIVLAGVFGLIAWRGKPAWGTRRAKLMAGMLAVGAILLVGAFAS